MWIGELHWASAHCAGALFFDADCSMRGVCAKSLQRPLPLSEQLLQLVEVDGLDQMMVEAGGA